MNIILRELKANLLSLIIWLVSLIVLFFAASTEFEAFNGNPDIQQAMAEFEIIFQALGTASADLTTPEGYLSLLSIYIYLPLAIYSGLLGSGIISKEEKNKTAEYLFTLPVSRNKVILSKLIASIIYTVVINVFVVISLMFIFGRFGADQVFYTFVINLGIGVLATQLIFLSIGAVLSSFLKHYKRSGSLTIAILIFTYMLNMLIGFVEELDFLKYITPFKYFSAADMLSGDFYLSFILITIGIIGGCFTGLFYFYKKRDLYI